MLAAIGGHVVEARAVSVGAEHRTAADAVDQLYATRAPDIFYHNAGLLELMITNVGVIGNPGFVPNSQSAGWRRGEYLYGAGLWVGAIASDNLPYVSTGMTTDGSLQLEFRPSLDPIDTVYRSYEGAPDANRPGFTSFPDDDGDGRTDEEFRNGRDDDGDGRIDEDYAGVSQQMLTCEYWDYTEEARARYPDHRPLDLRVRQTSYAWATPGSNEFIGFDFDVINDGFESLRNVYLGFFVDSDAGPRDNPNYFEDDAGGYYTTDTLFVDPTVDFSCSQRGEVRNCAVSEIHMDIVYMNDVPDNGEDADGGDVGGYFGAMFLGHTTDRQGERAPETVRMHTAQFFSRSGVYPEGDPRDDAQRYDLLQSGNKPRRPLDRPADYRYCFSAGPFPELPPGEQVNFQVAFVVGQGRRGMISNALTAQRVYDGAWADVDNNFITGLDGRETCLTVAEEGDQFIYTFPCDSLSTATLVVKEVECVPQNYVDDDCDCCTPLYKSFEEARIGREAHINWVGTVAPPPPNTNLDPDSNPCDPNGFQVEAAGDRSVVLNWDNTSELTADPIQRRILFAGYRVWRVEGWDRPIGSVGPAPEDWQLIADLGLDPADGLGAASPSFLGRYRNDIDSCYAVPTGSAVPSEAVKWYYPVGRYTYRDTAGLKNGMKYFYDITPYSAWLDEDGNRFELTGRPAALEREVVIPRWNATEPGRLDQVFVVPNPYVGRENPAGWDLHPANHDPTGTSIAFAGLPAEECNIYIYTLAGDLVRTLEHDGRAGSGTAFWDLITRSGQDVASGVYVFQVRTEREDMVGRFAIVR